MPAFVELIAPQSAVVPTCVIELEGQRGTMRIEWKGTPADVASFSRTLGELIVLIQITPQMRILVAIDAIDGRKGIDSLAQLCREKLDADPFSGCLFIFRSRRGTAIRILAYDGQGFWLATKRLSQGPFPVVAHRPERRERCVRIRRSCCWRPAIRMPKRRRYGGR